MAKILLTGAAGFIGFHTAKALLERKDKIIAIDNLCPYYDVNLKKARLKKISKKIKFYKADISDRKTLARIFKKHKIDKICHLAAQAGVRYSLTNPYEYEKTNVLGTINIFELMRKHKVKNIVYASSSSVYGGNKHMPFSEKDNVDKPVSLYAATKKSNELMAYTYHHLYDLNCTGMRYFTVYGPWGRPDMALFLFTKNIIKNKPIEVYNYGNMKRDFTFVTDIVQGNLAALDKSYPYEVFNIGNAKPVKLMTFIEHIEKTVGKKAKKKMMAIQPGDVPATCADISKAKKKLGYKPTVPVKEGIEKFVRWYKDYYKIK